MKYGCAFLDLIGRDENRCPVTTLETKPVSGAPTTNAIRRRLVGNKPLDVRIPTYNDRGNSKGVLQ